MRWDFAHYHMYNIANTIFVDALSPQTLEAKVEAFSPTNKLQSIMDPQRECDNQGLTGHYDFSISRWGCCHLNYCIQLDRVTKHFQVVLEHLGRCIELQGDYHIAANCHRSAFTRKIYGLMLFRPLSEYCFTWKLVQLRLQKHSWVLH